MERNYMKADAIAELDFISDPETRIHSHENIELLYLIEGRMRLRVGQENFWMKPGDIVLVNVNRKHSCLLKDEVLIGRFVISHIRLREVLGTEQIAFYCNSTDDQNSAYEELRSVILKIFNHYLANNIRNKLYLTSMYFQMLHILTENFLLNQSDIRYIQEKQNEDERMQDIFAYIRANYRQSIFLGQLAGQLYLSTSYVSRYIKQKCGMNFVDLVNQVRLVHAMEDLMYTDDSILKIALDNGFASVAAYNKVFRASYNMTPSEFRRQKKLTSGRLPGREKEIDQSIKEKVEIYLEKNPMASEDEILKKSLLLEADLDQVQGKKWDSFCCRMINIGTAKDLLNAEIQEQILARRQSMGFTYVRFWDIYDPDIYLYIHAEPGKRNYSRVNMLIDFLVKNHLKPYFEMGCKPIRIMSTTQDCIREIKREIEFRDDQERFDFYYDLIHHFTRRYGTEEVRTWYFEYWKDNYISFKDVTLQRAGIAPEESYQQYFHDFGIFASAIRSGLPEAKIGGGGFSVRMVGQEGLQNFFERWSQENEKPDFLSLNCYPYIQEEENGIIYEQRSTDVDFVEHCLDMTRNAMKKVGWEKKELHISEYSFSLSNRNVFNDSCLKGAFLVYNALRCFGKTELAGHWLYTDAYADDKDSDRPLFGGCGLLTKNGLPKPAYYALDYLNRIYPDIIKKGSNTIVTRSNRGSVRMVLHNLKRLNFNYHIVQEDKIQVRDISGMQENREYLTVHICLKNMKDGTYIIRKNVLNRTYGSVQDKWVELNMEPDLTMHELDYLRNSSISHNTVNQIQVTGNMMEFDTILEPNEIQYLYILQK